MKKLSLLSICFLISAASIAQTEYEKVQFEFLISNDYVTVLSPIEYYSDGGGWGESFMSVEGKYCFGAGMRLNYFMNNRFSSFLGVMIVDKGYRLHMYGDTDTGSYDATPKYYRIYLSIPLGISVNITKEFNPYFFMVGISPDIIMIYNHSNFNRFNASIMIGTGKRFDFGRRFRISIEPNFKIPITNYGTDILWFPDASHNYRPYSVGINIGLSR